MKKKVLIAVLTALTAISVVACGKQETEKESEETITPATGEITAVTVDDLDQEKMQIIDVRAVSYTHLDVYKRQVLIVLTPTQMTASIKESVRSR